MSILRTLLSMIVVVTICYHSLVLFLRTFSLKHGSSTLHGVLSMRGAPMQLKQSLLVFESGPNPDATLQHVFTDGTALHSDDGVHCLAPWGAINASTGLVVARGHLPGLQQASDRVELLGASSALQWQALHRCSLCLWMDNKFATDGLGFLMTHFEVPAHWEHFDLWEIILDCVTSLGDLELCCQLTDPLEEGFKDWNDRVDHLVAVHNRTLALHSS